MFFKTLFGPNAFSRPLICQAGFFISTHLIIVSKIFILITELRIVNRIDKVEFRSEILTDEEKKL